MKRRSIRFLFALALLVLAAAFAGCVGSRQTWTAQPVLAPGIAIQPVQAYRRGRLLFVQTMFVNQTGAPMVVDRDGAVLMMPSGAVLRRSVGTFTQHRPYMIPSGASQAVNVDFRAEGFDWDQVGSVQVNWSGAVSVNGAPVVLPPMVVRQ
jgi:hypothetical protein